MYCGISVFDSVVCLDSIPRWYIKILILPWPVARWLEHQPVDQRVKGLISDQTHIPWLQIPQIW